MQFDKFTLKSQEAIQAAQGLAESRGHQEVQPEHLLKVLIEQPDGVVVPVLQKMGVKPATILPEVDAARKFLMQVGYDPSFGARPLKRTIQKYVQDELAMQILSGTFQEGDQILVDTDPDTPALKFTKK